MKFTLSILLTTVAVNFVFGQSPPKKSVKSLVEIMKPYADTLAAKKYGVVALHKLNGKTEKYAIGLASPDEKMTTDKVFNIGSLTKTFTAVLVLQEIEKGKLKLQDSLAAFFPAKTCYNENVDLSITIEDLLHHRSGLGEVFGVSVFEDKLEYPYSAYNYSFLFNKIPEATGKRNTSYEYRNTNYILLGYILEIINDLPYEELLRRRIFNPCKMKNSYAYFSRSIKNIAHAIFNGEDATDSLSFNYFRNCSFSAGGISSTPEDLEKFFDHLYLNNTLISRKSFERMIEFKDDYGLGIERMVVMKEDNKTITYYGHGGDNVSFKVRNYYNPLTKELIIVMANHYRDPYTDEIAGELLSQ